MKDMFPYTLGLVIFVLAALLMYLLRRCAFDKREDDRAGRDGRNLRWCMDRVDCCMLVSALLIAIAVVAYLCFKPMSARAPHTDHVSSPLLPRYLVMSNHSDTSDPGSPVAVFPHNMQGFPPDSLYLTS